MAELKEYKKTERIPLPAPSVLLLMRVADRIEKHPVNFDMRAWVENDKLTEKIGSLRYKLETAAYKKAAGKDDVDIDEDRIDNQATIQAVRAHKKNGHAPFSCGTTACVGGFVALEVGIPEVELVPKVLIPKSLRHLQTKQDNDDYIDMPTLAARVILGKATASQSHLVRLFHDSNWPEPYRFLFQNLYGLPSTAGYGKTRPSLDELQATIAADRVRHFARTGF